MKSRFEGAAGRPNLISALKRQEFVGGNQALAEAMADLGRIVEFRNGQKLTVQDAVDDDIFLLLAGKVLVLINEIGRAHV